MAYMTVEGKKIWLGRFGFESPGEHGQHQAAVDLAGSIQA